MRPQPRWGVSPSLVRAGPRAVNTVLELHILTRFPHKTLLGAELWLFQCTA